MSNVARLGLEVNAKGVTEATSELAKLTTASKAAEKAAKDLSSQKGAAKAAVDAAKGYQAQSAAALAAARASATASKADIDAAKAAHAKATAVSMAARADYESVNASLAAANAEMKQTNALRMSARAAAGANDNLVKTHNTANIAAQGFDIVTTAAGGMNAGLIGMQQGLQLAQVAMSSGEGFAKTLGAAFMAMLNPMTFLIVGFTALSALLIQTVNWGWLASKAVDGIAWALENLAPYLAVAAGALALIYAPALLGGLALVATGLFNIGVAATSMAGSLTLAWLAAIGPVGWFIAGLATVVTAAVIFRDELTQILGFDIVGAAKTGVNAIIGAFVGAFLAVKATWKMLPAALGDLMILGANATIAAVEGMVNKIAAKLDGFIKKMYDSIKGLASYAGMELPDYKGMGGFDFGRVPNPYGGKGLDTGKAALNAAKGAIGPDYLGNMGDAIVAGASKGVAALKDLSKWLTTVDEKDKKKKSGGKTSEDKYSDIVQGAERRIASLNAERQAIGLTEEASAALRYEQDLLNQAQQKGLTLTDAQKGNLSALAQVMASVEASVAKAKEQFEKLKETVGFVKDTARGFVDDFVSGLKNGESAWKSFANAALGALNKIADKLLDSVFDSFFNTSTGPGGNWLMNLFGGGGQAGAILSGSAGPGLYARGTASARAGEAIVGEEGPELVRFKGGERVVPNHQMRAANNNKNQSGSGHFSYSSNIVVSGNGDKELMARMRKVAQEDFQSGITEYRRNGVQDDIKGYNDDPYKRG